MTSVYPAETKTSPPPTYEQAMYSALAPTVLPVSNMYPTAFASSSTPAASNSMYPISMMPLSTHGPPPIGTTMLITTQSLIYGDSPIQCTCPNCYQVIITRVQKKDGLLPWLICIGIFLMGAWLGCCLIPFCIESLKDTEHYCPHCAALLGTRRRI